MLSLSLPMGAEVLCIGAHPDDIEIGCGGTLLALCESFGIKAHHVVMTGSDARRREAEAAADLFVPGATTTFFGLRDGHLPAAWGVVKEALEDVAATMRPDLVLCPRRDDAHQDHRLLAQLVPTVWRDSLVLHYEIPKWDGDLGPVNHLVPLSDEQVARKVELLFKAYPSQVERDWWDEETFRAILRLRGVESRRRYAEGFVVDKAVVGLTRL